MSEPAEKQSHRTRNIVVPLIIVAVVIGLALAFFYEVIYVDWVSFMEDQPSIGYQEPPRRLPGVGTLPFTSPYYYDEPLTMENPVPPDEVSLQRGGVLYSVHCQLCHGPRGRGDGPITDHWLESARRPADLSAPRFAQYPDSLFYRVITQGIGGMPALRENMNERMYWDVINYVRSLQP
jgi:mono/diheme cytochrome c family protein